MKTIERLIRKNATEAGTWEPTHYTSLRQARQFNPGEYANHFRVATGEPVRTAIISDYPPVHKTRFSELGYWHNHGTGFSFWQVVDLTGGKPAQVGSQYATEKELLANLEAYATEYGCDGANPKPASSLTAAQVQAVRLLSEAYAVLELPQISEIATSMDITTAEVLARFEEAERVWESEKDRAVLTHGRIELETSAPARPIDRAYEGQAHHMSKAANSLVNMLNGLDYSKFSASDAIDLTSEIHNLISRIEYAAQDSEHFTDAEIAEELCELDDLMRTAPKGGRELAAETYPVTRTDDRVLRRENVADNLRRAQIGGAHDPRNDREG